PERGEGRRRERGNLRPPEGDLQAGVPQPHRRNDLLQPPGEARNPEDRRYPAGAAEEEAHGKEDLPGGNPESARVPGGDRLRSAVRGATAEADDPEPGAEPAGEDGPRRRPPRRRRRDDRQGHRRDRVQEEVDSPRQRGKVTRRSGPDRETAQLIVF